MAIVAVYPLVNNASGEYEEPVDWRTGGLIGGGFYPQKASAWPTSSLNTGLEWDSGEAYLVLKTNGTKLSFVIGASEYAAVSSTGLTVTGQTVSTGLRLTSQTTPASPSNGDFWFDGTSIYYRLGGVTKDLSATSVVAALPATSGVVKLYVAAEDPVNPYVAPVDSSGHGKFNGIESTVADSAVAVGVSLNTPAYTTTGAKLVSFQNNSVEKAWVDKDGHAGFGNVTTANLLRIGSGTDGILTFNSANGTNGSVGLRVQGSINGNLQVHHAGFGYPATWTTSPTYRYGVNQTSPAAALHVTSGDATGASAVASIIDTSTTWATAGAKLLSVRNNGTEKAYVNYVGDAYFYNSLSTGGNVTGVAYVGSRVDLNSTGTSGTSAINIASQNMTLAYDGANAPYVMTYDKALLLKAGAADGASAVGVIVDAFRAFSTAGSKLLSIRSGGVEKSYVDKDGEHYTSTYKHWHAGNLTPVTTAMMGAANGVATLDASGLVPTSQLPALSITDTFVAADQTAMLALTAQVGDVAVRTDLSKSFILKTAGASTLGNWQELLTPADAVSSVAGRTGAVTLAVADVSGAAPLANPSFTGTVQEAGSRVWTAATLNRADTIGAMNLCGFPDRTTSTISFVDGTRVFTLAPTGTNFVVWANNTKWTKTSSTVTLANTVGTHFIYIDGTGALVESTSPWDIASETTAPVASVYWSGTAGAVCDERHASHRDRSLHRYLHDTRGAAYEAGLAGTFTNTTLSITSGNIHDEDLEVTITAKTACRLWYRNASNQMVFENNIATPYKANAGVLQYDNAGTLTNINSSNYVKHWVYAANDTGYPIAVVIGQATSSNLTTTRNQGQPTFPNLQVQEWKLLYSVIYRNVGGTATFTESTDYRTSSSLPGGVVSSLPAASVNFTPTGNIASADVQNAIAELDTEKLKNTTDTLTGDLSVTGNVSAVTYVPATATSAILQGAIADGVSAVGTVLNNSVALATTGAKLTSFRNNGTEKLSVTKDGDLNFAVSGINVVNSTTTGGTLSFEGSAGPLFAITNDLGALNTSIFSVNDVTGIPSIEVLSTGEVKLAQYNGRALIGTGTVDATGSKLQVNGDVSAVTYRPTTATSAILRGAVADGASAVGVILDNSVSLTTNGAKILSVRNAGVEYFSINNQQLVSGTYFAAGSYVTTPNVFGSGGTLNLYGQSADGATYVGVAAGSSATVVTAGAKLLSIKNGATEKAYFDKDGSLWTINNVNASGYVATNTLTAFAANGLSVVGAPTDGASAVAVTINALNALTTSGAKILALKNNSVEKFSVTKDGALTTSSGLAWIDPNGAASFANSNATISSTGVTYLAGALTVGANGAGRQVYTQQVIGPTSAPLYLGSQVTDAAGAVGVSIDTPAYSTAGAKLLSIRNNTVEKAYFDKDGNLVVVSLSGHQLVGARTMGVSAAATDGASAVGVVLDNRVTLATAGAKLLSVRNNTVEKMYVGYDGTIIAPTIGVDGLLYTDGINTRTGNTLGISGGGGDSSTAVGIVLQSGAQTVAGAKIVSFRNSGTEKAYIDKDGAATFATVEAGTLWAAVASPAAIYGRQADGASAVGTVLNCAALTTSGAKLLSVKNNGTEKAYIDKDGGYFTTNGKFSLNSDGTIIGDYFRSNLGWLHTGTTNNVTLKLRGDPTNGATAVAVAIRSANALSTAGAKIINFYSDDGVTEKAYIDKNGSAYFAGSNGTGALRLDSNTVGSGWSGLFCAGAASSPTNANYSFIADNSTGVIVNSTATGFIQFRFNNVSKASIDKDGNITAPSFVGALTGNASTATTAAAAPWSGITSKPTTLSGYGITDAISTSALGANSGVATLDGSGKLTSTQIPAISLINTTVVANQAARLALTAEVGDVAVQTDTGKTYILATAGASVNANWTELLTTGAVSSVAGRTGTVTLGVADVSGAAPIASPTFTGTASGAFSASYLTVAGAVSTTLQRIQCTTAGADQIFDISTNPGKDLIVAGTSANGGFILNGGALGLRVQKAGTEVFNVGSTGGTSVISQAADGGSAIAHKLNTSTAWATNGAKLLSIQNNGAVKVDVGHAGDLNAPYFYASSWFSGPMYASSGLWTAQSNVGDGVNAIAFKLNSLNTLAASGTKLLSVQNNTVEKFSVTKDGVVTAADTISTSGAIYGGTLNSAWLQNGGAVRIRNSNADGAETALIVTTSNTWANASAKLASFQNNSVEKATIDKDGNFAATGYCVGVSGVGTGNGLFWATGTQAATVRGYAADGATAIGVAIEAGTALTVSGSKIASFRNAGVEKASIDKDGGIWAASASIFDNVIYSTALLPRNAGDSLTLVGRETDGATAVGVVVNNNVTLANATSKLVSIQNNGTEKTSILYNGEVYTGSNKHYHAGDFTIGNYAPLASPTFTGVPAAPTAAADTNTTQLATTAYVIGQRGSSIPEMNGTGSAGTSHKYSRENHVHPVDTSRAALVSPSFTTPNIGVATGTSLTLTGTLTAASKSFCIPHPTQEGKTLTYGSLEGPENGVYVRGRLKYTSLIVLPDCWRGLVDADTITVTLTPCTPGQRLYVDQIDGQYIYIGHEGIQPVDCFYTVYAERKDIPKLVVESPRGN